jgi:hypothetical protein
MHAARICFGVSAAATVDGMFHSNINVDSLIVNDSICLLCY